MATTIRPFLMFQGQAEEAMSFYVSLFPDSRIIDVKRYGAGQEGPEGSIKAAAFALGDQTVMCFDSPVKHDFGFTPAISMFVECESEADIRRIAGALSEGGAELMPLNSYGFSKLFAWVNDRFGVSWQLNFA